MQFNLVLNILFHTVQSFLELVPLILGLPGVSFFLSGKLNQDPLEKFFGCLRQQGRVNNNPTASEVIKSTQTFRVINSIRFYDIVGNCRGVKRKAIELEDIDMEPLKKRPRANSHSV